MTLILLQGVAATEQADSLEMELERMMDSAGCPRSFQIFFPIISTLPKLIGAASVCESDFPEEVTATQDADEKPQGADHFFKHTLLISSDIY